MTYARTAILAATLLAALPPAASARDDQRLLDIAAALATPAARDRFDDTITFHWAESEAPVIERSFSIHTSERRTFLPTRTEQEAC
jgi:hypothetical protein